MLRAPNTCSAEVKGCTGFDRKVTGNSDQPAKLSQAQRVFHDGRRALSFAKDDGHCTFVKVRYFSDRVHVSEHFLCNKSNQTTTVSGGVGHL